MKIKPILNRSGNIIGYEHQPNARRRQLLSRSAGLLGWQDTTTGVTFGKDGNVIAKSGDVLGSLLLKPKE